MIGPYLEEKKSYRGYTIKTWQDIDAPHPRKEYEQLGTIVDSSRNYDIGEEDMPRKYVPYYTNMWELFVHHINAKYEVLEPKNDFGNLSHDELEEVGYWMENNVWHQPIRMLDHGNVYLQVGTGPFSSDLYGMDSGTVGYIYVTKEDYLNFYNQTRDSLKLQKKVSKRLKSEVKEMGKYMSGQVYGYSVEDPQGGYVNSVGGYYDLGIMYERAEEDIDWHIRQNIEKHVNQLKTWIKNKVPLEHRKSLQTALRS